MDQVAPQPFSPAASKPGSIVLPVLIGLIAGALTILLGGYAALLALPGVWRSRRMLAYGLGALASVPIWLVVGALGYNPLSLLVRARIVDQLAGLTGDATPEIGEFSADPLTGRIVIRKLRCDVPQWKGKVSVEEIKALAGFGFLFPPETLLADGTRGRRLDVSGRGVEIFVIGDSDGPRHWSQRVAGLNLPGAEGSFSDVVLAVEGPNISTVAFARQMDFVSGGGEFSVQLLPDRVDLLVLGAALPLSCVGGAAVLARGGELTMSFDLRLSDEKLGKAIVQGNLTPRVGERGGLTVLVEDLNLADLWSRFRAGDVLEGQGRGSLRIGGTLDRLLVRSEFTVNDLRYFSRTSIRVGESRAFVAPQVHVEGGWLLDSDGALYLDEVKLEAGGATLSTSPTLSARGGLLVRLSGRWPEITGKGGMIVTDGKLAQPLRFTQLGENLDAIRPNLLDLGELFPSFDLDLGVTVEKLHVDCDPLRTTLAGELSAVFRQRRGSPSEVRLTGKLQSSDGKFEFLGASGDVTGYLEFQPNTQVAEATIRGTLKGAAGEAPIEAEITGRLGAPGLIFKRVTLDPAELGKRIVEAGEDKLTPAQRNERMSRLARLCGPRAVLERNPFAVAGSGVIFFEFRPGE